MGYQEEKQRQLDMRYLRMARVWAENSYCVRRQVSALIVKDKMIISDGYNGTPSGFENICEDELTGKTKPYVLHAEANAITKVAKSANNCDGSTLYITAALDWIKNSILNSELNDIFDLSKINWIKCEEFALKNRVKEVCEYWKDTNCDLSSLSNKFKLDKHTITKYLKTGSKFNWCNYTTTSFKVGKISSNRKEVEIIKDDVTLGVFSYVKELEEKSMELFGVKLLANGIRSVCAGFRKTYKGFTFKYVKGENNAS